MTELSISLTPELPTYIRDIRVRDAWTSPGLLVELALNAAPLPLLSEVRFGDALPTPGSADRLFAHSAGPRAPVVVSSATSGSSRRPATHLLAWAVDRRADEAPTDPHWADSAPPGAGASLNRDTLHRELERLGTAVHDDARVLSSAYFLPGRAGAIVELGEVAREDLPGYILHPLFVEATIQLARLLISRGAHGESPDDDSSLLEIGQISVEQPGTAVANVYVSTRLDVSRRHRLDASLVDASGLVVANLRGLRFGGKATLRAQLAGVRLERVNHAIARAVSNYRSGDDLLEGGATSLDLIRVVNNLQTEFGWSPDLPRLLEFRHSEALAAYYASADGGPELDDAPAPIPVDPTASIAPASLAQEQLWFLHRVDPQSPRYHIHLRARWRGHLDMPAFRKAADVLAARHGSLRTRFAIQQQEPVARTLTNAPIAISHIDLRGLPPSRQASQIELELAGDLRERFDLQNGPLYRISLLALSPDDHLVAFTFHHLIADGRSIELYLGELIEVYESISAGLEVPRPPGRLAYGDYARWQRQALAAGTYARDRAYWRAQLTGIPRLLLPDLPPAAVEPGAPEADCVPFSIAPPVADALKRLARAERTTLQSVLCAAYAHVLRCISGQDDFGIGTAALGRTRGELEDVLGLFSNSVVLRMQLAESTTFRGLLAAVRGVSLEALTHQAVPFVQVVQDVGADGADGNPLFRAAILSQAWSFPTFHDASARLTWEWDRLDAAPPGSARFDLELLCGDMPSGVALQFVYRSSALSPATARFFVQQLVVLLNLAARDPDADLATLGELEDARCKRVTRMAGPAIPYDHEVPLHRAIVDRCVREPMRIALVHRNRSISYGHLDHRTNQLARFLQKRGVARGTRVAVCLDRGIDMLVAVLAVLKAGGAYVPLDPRHPAPRRQWMIRDSGAALILTTTEHASTTDLGAIELLLDERSGAIAQTSIDPIDADVSGRDLAYLIYTSGSTGLPKGVMVEHRNVHNFFAGMSERVPDADGGVWLAATTMAFDISVLELLWTLTRGFRVVIADSFERDLRSHHDPTHLQCTPSVARLLTEHDEGRALLSRVKHLLVGGEALTRALADTLLDLGTGTLTNMYGPTETTVWSSTWRVERGSAEVSIGEPIANTQFYVLDERRKPVPWGATGELYIGGDGVARGYHGRTEETAGRFLPDPFAPGSRMYRTGDMVRALPNRTLQWLRRADRQVKIAGNRLELGEIEAALQLEPDVRQCAVTKQVFGGEDRLLAFVVPTDLARQKRALAVELQTRLRKRLPAYMIPSIIATEALELTANGKIDVAALPNMDALLSGPADAADRAPRTAHEQLLARVWEEVLGRPIPGVTARFFELGGTSLGAVRVCIKLEELGHAISPARLFEHPTIESLAQTLERGPESGIDLEAEGRFEVPIRFASQPAAAERAATLLTGATGFVGIHLLEQLLVQSDSTILCLVRSDDEAHGRARIARAAAHFGLSLDLGARVQVLSGAIDCSDLGLCSARLRELEYGIDTIYHNAAAVNFVAPYSELRQTNVEGTRHLLELACRGRRKAFHHVSTLNVADACPASSVRRVSETDPVSDFGRLRDGYSRSKWVAERMVRNAGAAGLAVAIYRLGIVVGSHANGRMPREEAFVRALCAIMNTGACVSPESRMIEHLSPVDDVARLIVRLSRTDDSAGRVFHVAHPEGVPLRELLAWTRGYGFGIEEMSMPSWLQALKRHDSYAEVYPIVRRLEEGQMTTLDCRRSLETMTALEDGWGPLDERAYGRMLEALVAAGEIAAPPDRGMG
jgi:myxalamid-type nonribosomal peptide synthetase MxaA